MISIIIIYHIHRDYITIYTKKNENNITIYLECNKRVKTKNKCSGKEKLVKRIVSYIYEDVYTKKNIIIKTYIWN